MYETYHNKKHHKKYGKGSIPSGPGGTSYPDPGLPSTQDGRNSTKITQSGNGASKPGQTYRKGGANRFPELNGLPS